MKPNPLYRLFQLSRAEYFADFFITPPVTVISIILSLLYGFSVWWPLLFISGLGIWTLYEYLVHRFIAHRVWGFRAVHTLHHQHQKDYIGTHPILTVAIYILLWLCFGIGNGSAVMVGFSVGYVYYSTLHTMFHYSIIRPGHWLFQVKRNHGIHHRFDNVNYGVSTSFWDRMLGTYRAPPT